MKKSVMLVLAAVLLMGVLFAGAASAVPDAAPVAADLYGINITNSTGTYQLTSELTTVYGDTGYAKLTGAGTATGTFTLELNNFKVDTVGKPTYGRSIINSTVPNLIIKLVGESNLTAKVVEYPAVFVAESNLTITNQTGELNGKLIVNNNNLPGAGKGIFVEDKDLHISGVNLTTQVSSGDTKSSSINRAIYVQNGDITIDGPTTVVEAHVSADGEDGGHAIAGNNITINGAKFVNATATGGRFLQNNPISALYATNDVVIEGTTVNVEVDVHTDLVGYSQAIYAERNIDIHDSRVNATADGNKGESDFKTSALFTRIGNITISGQSTVEAVARGHPHPNRDQSNSPYTICAGDEGSQEGRASSLTICDGSVVHAHGIGVGNIEGFGNWGVSLFATKDITIDSAREVNVTAQTTLNNPADAYGIWAYGTITISNSPNVIASANTRYSEGRGARAYAILGGNIRILDDSKVTAIANSPSTQAYAMYARAVDENTGNILIQSGSNVTASTTSGGLGRTIFAKDIWIDSPQDVNVTAVHVGEEGGALGIVASGSNLTISNSPKITVTVKSNNGVTALNAGNGNVTIRNSQLEVDANSTQGNADGINVNKNIWIDSSSRITVTAKASYDARAINVDEGNFTIRNSNVELYANSTAGNAYGINAKTDIVIDSSSRVTATAESPSDDKLAAGLYADTGDITIKNKARVTAKANATGALVEDMSGAYGMWAKAGNITITGKNTLVDAQTDGHPAFAFAISAGDMIGEPVEGVGHLRIKDGSTVQASATIDVLGNDGECLWTIFATNDIEIESAKKVTAIAKHMGAAGEGTGATGIHTQSGSISIINTEIIADVWHNSSSPWGIHSVSGDIIIDSSKVTAASKSNATADDGYGSDGFRAGNTITIKGADTVIDVESTANMAIGMSGNHVDIQSGDITVNATCIGEGLGYYGWGIYGRNGITISGCDRIKATGTNTSFVKFGGLGSLDFDALKTGYVFSNATSPGSDPTSFEQFKNDWHYDLDYASDFSNYTSVLIEKKATPTPYTPSHRESGQTVIQQQVPEVSTDPTPANQATADITVKYVGQSVLGTSTADSAALKEQYPEAAAQVELSFAMAMEAGIPLTNSKGAKAVVVTSEKIPNIEKVTFSRVYEISPANEGEKLTKVTVKVPKSDVTSKGLTSDDVTVYHYLESYKIWVPLETISMTQDDNNYYYTAATDGTSPFGVLVKKIGSETTTIKPTQPTTSKSPAPFVGLAAGLGAAALFLRLRK